MKRTYQQNKSLYESIMRDVAKIVKGRLNEDNSNSFFDFGDDRKDNTRTVTFGPSFSINDLKNPSEQQKIYNTLHNLYPEKFADITFNYERNQFSFCGTIRDENTKEEKTTTFVFPTIYQAAIYSSAIMGACVMYNNPKHTMFFDVSPAFNKIRKLIMHAISDKDYKAYNAVEDKMKDYLEQKLPQATTFEERVEAIKKACYIHKLFFK